MLFKNGKISHLEALSKIRPRGLPDSYEASNGVRLSIEVHCFCTDKNLRRQNSPARRRETLEGDLLANLSYHARKPEILGEFRELKPLGALCEGKVQKVHRPFRRCMTLRQEQNPKTTEYRLTVHFILLVKRRYVMNRNRTARVRTKTQPTRDEPRPSV